MFIDLSLDIPQDCSNKLGTNENVPERCHLFGKSRKINITKLILY